MTPVPHITGTDDVEAMYRFTHKPPFIGVWCDMAIPDLLLTEMLSLEPYEKPVQSAGHAEDHSSQKLGTLSST